MGEQEGDEEESTIVFTDGIPIEPVENSAQLPVPALAFDPDKEARCYVRDENAFYKWSNREWTKIDPDAL